MTVGSKSKAANTTASKAASKASVISETPAPALAQVSIAAPNPPASKAIISKTSSSRPPTKSKPAARPRRAVPAQSPQVRPPQVRPTQVRPSEALAPQAAKEKNKDNKKKPKLVRDSFTMPHEDFDLIAQIKARMIDMKRPVKKSELLRAGLQVLNALDNKALLKSIAGLLELKAGRPKSNKQMLNGEARR